MVPNGHISLKNTIEWKITIYPYKNYSINTTFRPKIRITLNCICRVTDVITKHNLFNKFLYEEIITSH